ncbi:hypothetical protein FGO68_gene10566 [Halteria grandinella]|uniref:Uncharacterized protein n=1 Tax=Halteria grandinella TaxID=5974 RepID=A0A8J8SZ82_HALGN|nr:hypothetical protein FGO68_gene10566 [Halteria grandinella]
MEYQIYQNCKGLNYIRIHLTSRHMFKAYNYLLTKHPLVTKSVTCGVISFFGDAVGQLIEIKTMKSQDGILDFKRMSTFFLYGSLILGPTLHSWYARILPRLVPQVGGFAALKKMLIDQAIVPPTLIFVFYSFFNFVEGKSATHTKNELRNKYLETLMLNYKVWPFANFVNFMLVPIQYQVLFQNFISLFFTAALSIIKNSKASKSESKQVKVEF